MISGQGDHLEGKRISERYRIKSVRRWTEHTVFACAEDMQSGQTVDLILLEANSVKDSASFLKEVEKKVQIRHRNLRQVIAHGTSSDGDLFIALELCDSSLSKLLAGKTPTIKEALSYLFQIADGLDFLARKSEAFPLPYPQSVYLNQANGQSVLKLNHLYFTEKALPSELLFEEELSPIIEARVKAPELIKGGRADARSQIYLLSCLLYQMISGKFPFESDDLVELESQHLCVNPRRIHEVRPDLYVDPRLESVILKGLSKEPAQRQSSIAQFKTELKDAVSKNPGLIKSLRTAAAVLLLGVSVLCAVQLSGLMHNSQPDNPPLQTDPPPLPIDRNDPPLNTDPATKIYTPEELGMPSIPKNAEKLGVLKLSALDKKELKPGDYLCSQLELSGKASIKAGPGVRLWVVPESAQVTAISLKDESALLSESATGDFHIYDCSASEIKMRGQSRLRAEVLAPAALLDAGDEASIEGKFSSNGQKLTEKARFLNSESE